MMQPLLVTLTGDDTPSKKIFFTFEQLNRMRDRQSLEIMGFAWAALLPLIPIAVEAGRGIWYMIKKPIPRDTNPGVMLPADAPPPPATPGMLSISPVALGIGALAAIFLLKR